MGPFLTSLWITSTNIASFGSSLAAAWSKSNPGLAGSRPVKVKKEQIFEFWLTSTEKERRYISNLFDFQKDWGGGVGVKGF